MVQSVIEILSIVTVLLILIFAFFLISIKEWNKLNIRILFFFLLVNAAYIIAFLLISQVRPFTFYITSVFYFLHSTGFLFGPLLYLYSKSLTYNAEKLSRKDLLNFLPFILAFCYILLRIFILFFRNEIWITKGENSAYQILFNITVLFYMIMAINELRRYRVRIENYYSSIEGIRYSWLAVVLLGFLFMWTLDLFHFIAAQFFEINQLLDSLLTALSLTINLCTALLIYYKGLIQPQLFHPVEITEEKPKYEKSPLTGSQAKLYLNQLKTFMEKEKPYLSPDLTIDQLSEKIGIPSRFISQMINDNLKLNFYEFVGSYRIEESKKYLSDSGLGEKTILEILYESGFNSKSAFNKAFKEYTGLTPTQFRRRNLSSS
jgi:AraC-like DNA-binding protein